MFTMKLIYYETITMKCIYDEMITMKCSYDEMITMKCSYDEMITMKNFTMKQYSAVKNIRSSVKKVNSNFVQI
jgi:hypothetical protein